MTILTREEIEATDAKGPAADVTPVEHLQQALGEVAQQVRDLQERLDRDSHYSHQPPSTDGFKRLPRSQRQPSGKKPGYISTLRKHGSHVFTALERVFRGDLPLLSLSG